MTTNLMEANEQIQALTQQRDLLLEACQRSAEIAEWLFNNPSHPRRTMAAQDAMDILKIAAACQPDYQPSPLLSSEKDNELLAFLKVVVENRHDERVIQAAREFIAAATTDTARVPAPAEAGEGQQAVPAKTYDFITLSGRHLATIATDDPDSQASELAHHKGIDPGEITWEEAGQE